MELVVAAMQTCEDSAVVAECACGTLAHLAWKNSSNQKCAVDVGEQHTHDNQSGLVCIKDVV